MKHRDAGDEGGGMLILSFLIFALIVSSFAKECWPQQLQTEKHPKVELP